MGDPSAPARLVRAFERDPRALLGDAEGWLTFIEGARKTGPARGKLAEPRLEQVLEAVHDRMRSLGEVHLSLDREVVTIVVTARWPDGAGLAYRVRALPGRDALWYRERGRPGRLPWYMVARQRGGRIDVETVTGDRSQRRMRALEGEPVLRRMYDGAVASWRKEKRLPPSAGPVPATAQGCKRRRPVPHASAADTWAGATWEALHMRTEGPLYFRYSFVASAPGEPARFTARATADLDCDGVLPAAASNAYEPWSEDPMKPLDVVPIEAPPEDQRARRAADFAEAGTRKTRYSLPDRLDSSSPVGYRTRVSLTRGQAAEAVALLSMGRPTGFAPAAPVSEQALFEECALGVLSSRQSTNFRGLRQVSFGPARSGEIQSLLARLRGAEAAPLGGAAYTHLVLGRPYRNPFTMLLTLVGHRPLTSPFSVAKRLFRKRLRFIDDIPTIGFLPHLHVGILADAMERAAVVASAGQRRALGLMAPFCGASREANRDTIRQLEKLCGLGAAERAAGWRLALAVQVGDALPDERVALSDTTARRLGANLLAFRSERIQPGVNQEDRAPPAYQVRQDMDVPEALTVMGGRAAYNAFEHWTGVGREDGKSLLLLDRIDVLTPHGKARLRSIRGTNEAITDRVVREMPVWADLPTGRAFSRNAERGRKAFALAGQRIYIGGLSRPECEAAGLDWEAAVRAVGAAAARGGLYAELMGATGIPDDCDLLAGICLMAGPVNQNDIGKTYYGIPDLLAERYADRNPTALLVWTLKAKTVADPIGNEEQLLNAKRKGALVDLRPGPHEVVSIDKSGLQPMRSRAGRVNAERAFADVGNFVTSPDGTPIPGNAGEPWSGELSVW